ncbi:hypothetical protein KUCAC02_003528 [Chaenocephalus aceratus]|uniref:Uncharacterized protein n=1 Tax=Chaenocephalus aceratus TaxID=36190 RepID=A0ACB9WMK2_CHAAC|nr:hypothetical protein KUCAC02_003528 [Chaenocephalus aceratus]
MERQLHLNLVTSRPPMAGGLQSSSKMKMGPGRKRDFTPLSWSQYFETIEDVESLLQRRPWSRAAPAPWRRTLCSLLGRVHCCNMQQDQLQGGCYGPSSSWDIGKVVEVLYGDNPPPIMIIGHSMGGAIAVHTAAANHIPSLLGLCVIDVCGSMQNFLRSRPKTFKSLENAIEWSVKSGQIRNIESARVSMGGQVKKCEEPPSSPAVKKESIFTWRVELSKTEKYWEGWFRGLSALFLTCPMPKLLLLAGVDRLDKDLTIGQMQGKFQMQVLPQCGHAVHEDAPEKVADALATFMVRHKFTEFKEAYLW